MHKPHRAHVIFELAIGMKWKNWIDSCVWFEGAQERDVHLRMGMHVHASLGFQHQQLVSKCCGLSVNIFFFQAMVQFSFWITFIVWSRWGWNTNIVLWEVYANRSWKVWLLPWDLAVMRWLVETYMIVVCAMYCSYPLQLYPLMVTGMATTKEFAKSINRRT